MLDYHSVGGVKLGTGAENCDENYKKSSRITFTWSSNRTKLGIPSQPTNADRYTYWYIYGRLGDSIGVDENRQGRIKG